MVSTIRRTLLACLQVYKQWGNAGNGGGSVDVTFPISFTKTVYQIQLTCNSDSYENPVYAIKDTKSFSYWSKYGGDKLWFALGMQQWGATTSPSEDVTYPIPVSRVLCLLLTTRATTFRYSPWPTKITTKSFQAVSDCEPVYWFLVAKQQWGVINAPAFPDDGQPVTFPVKFSKIPSVITAINQAKNSVSSTQLFTASINTYATTSNMILHRYGGLTASDVRVDWFAWSV